MPSIFSDQNHLNTHNIIMMTSEFVHTVQSIYNMIFSFPNNDSWGNNGKERKL